MTTTFQWRPHEIKEHATRYAGNDIDADCWHVTPHGRGYQIVGGHNAQPIATIRRFEPMPGQFRYMGKLWEWNAMAGSYIVHNYEFATANNCRSHLNKWIKRIVPDDVIIIGGKRGRKRDARAAMRERARQRRMARKRAERWAEIERQIELARLPTSASRDEAIARLVEYEMQQEEAAAAAEREMKLKSRALR